MLLGQIQDSLERKRKPFFLSEQVTWSRQGVRISALFSGSAASKHVNSVHGFYQVQEPAAALNHILSGSKTAVLRLVSEMNSSTLQNRHTGSSDLHKGKNMFHSEPLVDILISRSKKKRTARLH